MSAALFGGSLGFALPWLLLALVLLPVIWWFLRATPPAPRNQYFPALQLLLGLRPKETTAQRTPWWLLLLRLTIAALLIIAFAGPVMNPNRDGGDGPLTLIIDNDWAAAQHWELRTRQLDGLLAQAQRKARAVTAILTTHPDQDSAVIGPATASEMRRLLGELQPRPQRADRTLAAAHLATKPSEQAVHWISNGLAATGDEALTQALSGRETTLVLDSNPLEDRSPVRLLAANNGAGRTLTFLAERSDTSSARSVRALGKDTEGRLVAEVVALLRPGEQQAQLVFDLPRELRNRLERIELEALPSAGSVQLLDESFRRRSIGIAADGNDSAANRLLAPGYYLEVALDRFADVEVANIEALISSGKAIIFWPDSALLNRTDRDRLVAWVNQGGTLVRFAGPNLAAATADPGAPRDDLLPVTLRPGDRSRGGAMNWGAPAQLGEAPKGSPLTDLALPESVTVSRQVLADPGVQLEARTWLTLEDGTPLITGQQVGSIETGGGRIVLVHTSAGPRWSTLAFSGFYVELLRKLVATSNSVETEVARQRALPPKYVLDGFGRRIAPGATVLPLRPEAPAEATAQTPPGLYGTDSEARVINLSKAEQSFEPLEIDGGWQVERFDDQGERDLKPWLLMAGFVLFLLDVIARTQMAGGYRLKLAALLATTLLAPHLTPTAQANDQRDALAILDTRLGYIRTGNGQLDATSRAGLYGLTEWVTKRSSIELGLPTGIDLAKDALIFHPLIYWPLQKDQGGLPADQVAKINDYLSAGGLLVIDSRDGGIGGALTQGRRSNRTITRALRGINVPRLAPVGEKHVLTRAFYLLDRFPGRWAGGTVWAAADTGDLAAGIVNDGVSPIILGNADWAAAWAVDGTGAALFPTVPGTDRQREFAFRFGMNAVMYALAGNYKADQVHSKAIIQRLSGETTQDDGILRGQLLDQLRNQQRLFSPSLPDVTPFPALPSFPLQPRPSERGFD